MRLKNKGFLYLIGLIMVATIWQGCTPLPDRTPETTVESREEVSPLALPATNEGKSEISPLAPPTTEVSIPIQAAKTVDWAQADLAAQLDTTADQITVVSVEFVQWRDSSLGCPQPGMMYAQVITPGYRILLQSGEKLFEYHSAQGRDSAVLCKSGAAGEKKYLPLPIVTQPPTDSTQ